MFNVSLINNSNHLDMNHAVTDQSFMEYRLRFLLSRGRGKMLLKKNRVKHSVTLLHLIISVQQNLI